MRRLLAIASVAFVALSAPAFAQSNSASGQGGANQAQQGSNDQNAAGGALAQESTPGLFSDTNTILIGGGLLIGGGALIAVAVSNSQSNDNNPTSP